MLSDLLIILGIALASWRLYSRYATPSSLPLAITRGDKVRLSTERTYRIGRHTDLLRTWVGLRLHTTKLNRAHDGLIEWLDRRLTPRIFLHAFYDLGAIIAIAGMIGSIAIMLWAATQILSHLYKSPVHITPSPPYSSLSKRGVEISNFGSQSEVALRPIIPGFTVPLFHSPVIFLALLFCQVVHELGHAVAAAADSISVIAAGISLTLVFPSAYVALPGNSNQNRPRFQARVGLRIASAGPWHNFLLYAGLTVAGWFSMNSRGSLWVMRSFGLWQDSSQFGPTVVGIMNSSPLKGHIPLSSTIIKLDDTHLGGVDTTSHAWDRYLMTDGDDIKGWCVSRSWFKVQASSCCQKHGLFNDDNGLCFAPADAQPTFYKDSHLDQARCVDPVTLFMTPSEAVDTREPSLSTSRCHNICMQSESGDTDQLCIRPHKDVQLLRISLLLPPWEIVGDKRSKTVIWNGPKAEVWEQVSIGTLRPRYRWISAYLPIWVELFFYYVKLLSLSLFVFNLLPIRPLDGGQILSLALDFVQPTSLETREDQFDLEAFEEAVGPRDQFSSIPSWRVGLEKWIGICTVGLVFLVSAGSLLNEMKNIYL